MLHLWRRTLRRISTYWQILTRRGRVTCNIDEEMRFHVEMETERLREEHGLPMEEARRRAVVSFGGVVKYQEAGRAVLGWSRTVVAVTPLVGGLLLLGAAGVKGGAFALRQADAAGV